MKRTIQSMPPWVIGVILLGVGAIGLVVGATALADGTETRKTETLRFLLREQVVPQGDGPPQDFQHALYRGELLDPKTRKPVGTEIGYCVITDRANEFRSNCSIVFTPKATTSLASADQIVASPVFDSVPAANVLSAVTGGTGRFAGVTGQLVSKEGPDGLVDVTFQLRR